jgi:hypothetical protein
VKPIEGYDQAASFDGSRFPTIPAGGYVCEIKFARADTTKPHPDGSGGEPMLVLAIDIAEGPHKGFYERRYQSDRGQDPNSKWRGVYNQMLYMNNAVSGYFKGLMTAIERSNPGYHWDWNEAGLKGKKVGFIFREEEYVNGRGETRTITKPAFPRDVDTIRKGVEVPEIKRLNAQRAAPQPQQPPAFGQGFTQVPQDDELPF